MGGVLLIIVVLVAMVYSLIEVAHTESRRVRLMPRWLWVVAILFLPGLGALCWLIAGRPLRDAARKPPTRPKAPDDDPEFLRKLR